MVIRLALLFLVVTKIETKIITLFQAVDSSFVNIWLNWWAIAIGTKSLPDRYNFNLYLACFGGDVDYFIRQVHAPGCSEIILGEMHKKRIYYTKWLSITNALRQGHDMLVLDIDAFLIREPLHFLNSDLDIVLSRDHGPGDLEDAEHWAWGRLCTGAIFFRYSERVLELVEFALERVRKYGHDQIQFNKAASANALVWRDSPEAMANESVSHDGFMAWTRPTLPGFQLFPNETDKDRFRQNWQLRNIAVDALIDNGGGSVGRITFRMLDRYAVLRYCNGPQERMRDWIRFLYVPAQIGKDREGESEALHCFVEAGPLGEQGSRKRDLKISVTHALNMWVLKPEWTWPGHGSIISKKITEAASTSTTKGRAASDSSNVLSLPLLRKRREVGGFFDVAVDQDAFSLFEAVWVRGRRHLAENPFNVSEKKGMTGVSLKILKEAQFMIESGLPDRDESVSSRKRLPSRSKSRRFD